ncbi:putative short chain dehydrogenase/reductase [Acrocarpospora pleiomorpha]|uniref:Putative short chain dehydrogenase/reductase n=1 Tax=Acrocarpospora pleiomorpha TaxID=90975 RepID=A0A5M3X8X2_9ACTN|nr:mycofactocin-coupled SDR family oxidoreductase [Acrocarpospora pleiomorpha]GES17544.1 putative short chain dehydrogenase/reductase [Acrocarpospora pleiomorpha]
MPDMNGKVALVTGAGRGIGAATVRALCARGYRVVAVDSCAADGPDRPAGVTYPLANPDDLKSLAAGHPDAVLPYVADVRDRDALAKAAGLAVDRFGRLDAAVAAAAVVAGGLPLWETPATQLNTLWEVDVLGVWNTAAVCVPPMLAGPDPTGCRFVAVASAAASHGLFHLSAYNTAKHAVVGLVRGLAADLVGTGVTAAAVSPGSTRTPMLTATAGVYDLDGPDDFARSQLLRRLLEPDEIAETIAFCCSPAGGVLNGSIVSADGGFTP